ncbi:MAG TPA: 2Fe-2S iron-sulfur cluster-binding protein [Planctomycetota bacterium]|jgi:NADH-quinone oxidoreductase subunit G|nr:2Fe-2S iron-sulfur cluster-binding protein [Planctomycetota bacterium]
MTDFPEKRIRLTVDGEALEAPAGRNLLSFLNGLGKEIPHFCWHPGLSVVASCRQCQVEVQGPGSAPRRLAVACRAETSEGLLVWTETDAAKKARRAVLEFLLVHHPLDCPICDKAGECPLQNYTFAQGQSASRSEGEKRPFRKRVDLGAVITLDEERCVLCSRCVRFFPEVTGETQLGIFGRGLHAMVGTPGDRPLTGLYQGNLADLCPVGALTLKKFAHVARIWNLRSTPSVCPLCSRGCNTFVDTTRGSVVRIRPRPNPEVNGFWMCDVGRLGFGDLEERERLTSVVVRAPGGEARDLGYERGLPAIAERLASGGPRLLLLASPFLTNEEGAEFAGLARALETPLLFLSPARGEGDSILRTEDPCPNRRGLLEGGFEGLGEEEVATRLEGASAVFLAGERILSLVPPEALSRLESGSPPAFLVERRLVPWAQACVPARTWAEKSGTFTNVDGRRQAIAPALAPPPGVHPETEVFETLARSLASAPLRSAGR